MRRRNTDSFDDVDFLVASQQQTIASVRGSPLAVVSPPVQSKDIIGASTEMPATSKDNEFLGAFTGTFQLPPGNSIFEPIQSLERRDSQVKISDSKSTSAPSTPARSNHQDLKRPYFQEDRVYDKYVGKHAEPQSLANKQAYPGSETRVPHHLRAGFATHALSSRPTLRASARHPPWEEMSSSSRQNKSDVSATSSPDVLRNNEYANAPTPNGRSPRRRSSHTSNSLLITNLNSPYKGGSPSLSAADIMTRGSPFRSPAQQPSQKEAPTDHVSPYEKGTFKLRQIGSPSPKLGPAPRTPPLSPFDDSLSPGLSSKSPYEKNSFRLKSPSRSSPIMGSPTNNTSLRKAEKKNLSGDDFSLPGDKRRNRLRPDSSFSRRSLFDRHEKSGGSATSSPKELAREQDEELRHSPLFMSLTGGTVPGEAKRSMLPVSSSMGPSALESSESRKYFASSPVTIQNRKHRILSDISESIDSYRGTPSPVPPTLADSGEFNPEMAGLSRDLRCNLLSAYAREDATTGQNHDSLSVSNSNDLSRSSSHSGGGLSKRGDKAKTHLNIAEKLAARVEGRMALEKTKRTKATSLTSNKLFLDQEASENAHTGFLNGKTTIGFGEAYFGSDASHAQTTAVTFVSDDQSSHIDFAGKSQKPHVKIAYEPPTRANQAADDEEDLFGGKSAWRNGGQPFKRITSVNTLVPRSKKHAGGEQLRVAKMDNSSDVATLQAAKEVSPGRESTAEAKGNLDEYIYKSLNVSTSRKARQNNLEVTESAGVKLEVDMSTNKLTNEDEEEEGEDIGRASNSLLFFRSGVKRGDLLEVTENLVEMRNTMTVTGRTAMKRVFPEVKNGKKIYVNGTEIALFRHKNTVYAIGTQCPHRKGPLHLGDIEDVEKHGLCVVCPWHRWTFRLVDGALVKPANRDVQAAETYVVEVDDITDEICIGFQEFSDQLFCGDVEF